MTGLERRSAFAPVPSSLSHYNPNSSISGDLFKVHQESSPDYSNMPYYNHLPHSIPSIPIHSYNRSQVPSHPRQTESHSPFQLNTPTNDNETFHSTLPNIQPNDKLLVKVSDSSMLMSDVKPKSNKSKTRNKRKLDVLSSLPSNIIGSNVDISSYSDKSEVSKRRKNKSSSDSNIVTQNNNNSQIDIKVDSDEDWDIKNEDQSFTSSKKSPTSSISPSKVNHHDYLLLSLNLSFYSSHFIK